MNNMWYISDLNRHGAVNSIGYPLKKFALARAKAKYINARMNSTFQIFDDKKDIEYTYIKKTFGWEEK